MKQGDELVKIIFNLIKENTIRKIQTNTSKTLQYKTALLVRHVDGVNVNGEIHTEYKGKY